jgi:putative secretion ATPase (PEP-CTERM system associated)
VYQSYYNLTGKPFRLSPDPAFFFPSRGHKRALAYLRYGLHQNEGFVVITGAPGTGKTTLAQILLDEMGQKNVVVAHLTTTQLEADDMLRMVAASFGLRYEHLDKAALLKTIESFLLARSREGKRALLVIDEAQNLPARSLEELRMLSNLHVGDNALLQTFLLGQVQFRKMLEDPDLEQLRQRVIANFHLSPLAADESQRYIEARLRHVGWDNDPHFAEVAFEKIHQYTEGVPRRINMLCDRIMLYGCMEEQHNVTGELVDMVRRELEQEVTGYDSVDADQVTESSSNDSVAEPASNKAGPEKTDDSQDTQVTTPVEHSQSAKSQSQQAPSKGQTTPNKPARQKQKNAQPKQNQPAKTEQNVNAAAAKSMAESDEPDHTTMAAKAAPQEDAPIETPEQAEAREHRAEPYMPVLDADEEDFIEITEDFIAAFDKSISISDDDTEEPATTVRKPTTWEQQDKPTGTAPRKNLRQESSWEQDNDKTEVALQEEGHADEPSEDGDVLGNTVKHKQVAEVDTEDNIELVEEEESPAAAQISERDLFRVIPGGKGNTGKDNGAGGSPADTPKTPMAPAASAAPSSEDVVLRRILRLVLAFHRSPSSFPGLDDPTQPLPEGVSELLELAVSDDQVLTKVSPAAVMGISPVMLRAAVRFFVRRTLFSARGDYHRILGLTSNASVADIERHYDLLMRLLRQDKQPGAAECVDKVGRAYEALMRIDDNPIVSAPDHPVDSTKPATDASDNKAAAVLEALENPELTIDFSRDVKPEPKQQPVAAFLNNAGGDHYTPDPRITRRRFHLLGQAAILGIGALVVVLVIFISQLEPSETRDARARNENLVASEPPVAEESSVNSPNQDLALNDGTSEESVSKERAVMAADVAAEDEHSNRQDNRDSSAKLASSTSDHSPAKPAKHENRREKTSPVRIASSSEAASTPKPSAKTSSSSSTKKFTPVPVKSKDTDTQTQTEPTAVATAQQNSQPAPVPVKQFKPGSTQSSGSVKTQQQPQSVPVTPKSQDLASPLPSSSNETVATQTAPSRFQPVPVQEKSSVANTSSVPVTERTPSSTAGTSAPQNTAVPQNQFEGKDIPLAATSVQDTTASAAAAGNASSVLAGSGTSGISKVQLNQLLKDYARAFENGDLNNLVALFESTARTNTQTSKKGIESELRQLFSTSASRNITLIPTVWDEQGHFARGVGKFSQTVVPQGGQPTTVKGKYTIQARLDDGQVKISRFYTSNEVTSTNQAANNRAPRQGELKALLTSFTKYYENGDIDQLMSLFANNAQTNDQTTLSGIRKDHMDLFNTTDARQMFLKNISWTVKGNVAKGNGNFEVMVQPKGQTEFASVKGTIDVEAVKNGNQVKITKFFHHQK